MKQYLVLSGNLKTKSCYFVAVFIFSLSLLLFTNSSVHALDSPNVDAPQLLTPAHESVVNGNSILHTWEPLNNASTYIYRSYSDANLQNISETKVTTEPQLVLSNIADGTTYWWYVVALDASGNVSGESEVWKVSVDNIPPTIPTGGNPRDVLVKTDEVDFAWNTSTDLQTDVMYEFRLSQVSSQLGQAADDSGAWMSGLLTPSSIRQTGLVDGTWYWQVRASDEAGNKTPWSDTWYVSIDTYEPPLPIKPLVMVDGLLKDDYIVTGTTNSSSAIFTIKIDNVIREMSVETIDNGDGTYSWYFKLPEDVRDGLIHEVSIVVNVEGVNSDEQIREFQVKLLNSQINQSIDIDKNASDQILLEQRSALINEPLETPSNFSDLSITQSIVPSDVSVLQTNSAKPAIDNVPFVAVTPTQNGWKLLGILWYWWILLLGAMVAILYRLILRKRAVALK